MQLLCSACSTRPTGVRGHDLLDALEWPHRLYRCRTCHADWERDSSGYGPIIWRLIGVAQPEQAGD